MREAFGADLVRGNAVTLPLAHIGQLIVADGPRKGRVAATRRGRDDVAGSEALLTRGVRPRTEAEVVLDAAVTLRNVSMPTTRRLQKEYEYVVAAADVQPTDDLAVEAVPATEGGRVAIGDRDVWRARLVAVQVVDPVSAKDFVLRNTSASQNKTPCCIDIYMYVVSLTSSSWSNCRVMTLVLLP